ncbi:MAG TPA: hypothetical protein VNT75_13935 [Symbiobacteriaceae bacterium]|nr:hypothetical protein [Symbiobacteriaceae bacterium]
MRKWYPILLMVLALVLLTACSKKQPEQTTGDGPTLDDVRKQAQVALDGSLPSKEREPARDKAMSLLLQVLRQPDSLKTPQAEWEKPFKAGEPVRLHYFETEGKVKAYGLTLPGSGIVPPGQRVALQYTGSGGPQAFEVEVMPGGQLVGARSLDDKSVLLVFGLARGGGYIGYYQRDTRTGEFKPDPTAFRGLPGTVGDVRLEAKGNFLLIDVPVDSAWRPQFDKTHPLRLYFTADLGVEWKGKFAVVDERNFTAFEGFVTAANTGASKEERLEAWEKATRKLPAYLEQMESLQEQFLPKLPKGAQEQIERANNMTVRVVSIPAPEGLGRQSFTVIQHRVGNGLPMATVPTLPGAVETVHVVEPDGLPGLVILSVPDSGKGRVLSLFRVNSANVWEPAPEWYGFLPPAEPGLKVQRGPGPADLTLEPDDAKGSVTLQPDRSVQICKAPADCYSVSWVGGRLSAAGWVTAKVRRIASLELVSTAEVTQVADVVKQYLQTPEAAGISAAQLAAMVGAPAGLAPLGWDFGTAKVLAFPPNGSGLMPLLIQSGKTVITETYTPRTITQWLEVREVQAGGKRWLLALGRSTGSASLLLYEWSGETWQPANALNQEVNLPIGPSTRILYKPGQTDPVRGLYVSGSTQMKAYFTPDGAGVAFCDNGRPCTVYQFSTQWVLK